mmetsp:Transcript_39179/g.77025  ORF Transcript_39179/g.77025 Transcript_39179/m.77025 type:complete len:323 (-) Transcript_39179:83-1051(-)
MRRVEIDWEQQDAPFAEVRRDRRHIGQVPAHSHTRRVQDKDVRLVHAPSDRVDGRSSCASQRLQHLDQLELAHIKHQCSSSVGPSSDEPAVRGSSQARQRLVGSRTLTFLFDQEVPFWRESLPVHALEVGVVGQVVGEQGRELASGFVLQNPREVCVEHDVFDIHHYHVVRVEIALHVNPLHQLCHGRHVPFLSQQPAEHTFAGALFGSFGHPPVVVAELAASRQRVAVYEPLPFPCLEVEVSLLAHLADDIGHQAVGRGRRDLRSGDDGFRHNVGPVLLYPPLHAFRLLEQAGDLCLHTFLHNLVDHIQQHLLESGLLCLD